jgi:hypothetical protein
VQDDALAEQGEAGTAVHLAFEHLVTVIRARRVGLPADGEDGVGRAGGAGRVLLAAGVVGYRAPRAGADGPGWRSWRPPHASALVAGLGELDPGPGGAPSRRGGVRGGDPLPIALSRMGHLWDALARACDDLGFDRATGGLRCSGQLAPARIIEPVSKLDSLRVLEIEVSAPSYRTVLWRLPVYARASWRRQLAVILTGYQLAGSQCPTTDDH